MAGPYTFEIDRESGTWRALNDSGSEVSTGDLPLTEPDRIETILADHGITDPLASAIADIVTSNWSEIERDG